MAYRKRFLPLRKVGPDYDRLEAVQKYKFGMLEIDVLDKIDPALLGHRFYVTWDIRRNVRHKFVSLNVFDRDADSFSGLVGGLHYDQPTPELVTAFIRSTMDRITEIESQFADDLCDLDIPY